jgi:hypothetical protein
MVVLSKMMVYANQVAPGWAQTNLNEQNSKFKTGKLTQDIHYVIVWNTLHPTLLN